MSTTLTPYLSFGGNTREDSIDSAPCVRRRGAAGRPRAPRCGRPAAQALAFGQRGAPTARDALFECVSAPLVESGGFRERELKAERSVAVSVGTSRVALDGRWFWSRSRGNVWVTGEV